LGKRLEGDNGHIPSLLNLILTDCSSQCLPDDDSVPSQAQNCPALGFSRHSGLQPWLLRQEAFISMLKPSRAFVGRFFRCQSHSIAPFVGLTVSSLQIRFDCLLGYDGLCHLIHPSAEAQ
jgi:hypothetical protein